MPEPTEAKTEQKVRAGNVQSIGRTFGLLEAMAAHGGRMGLSQLAHESGLPLPTIPARADLGRAGIPPSGALTSVRTRPQADSTR